ncbi:AAA family ATPase [Thioalkalivibrio sp.]|uniref:AAA family ATPase n=1 Tax=Thioalkalivibrio sp. TaxID=2093813 RepID=UPI003561FDCF
MPLIRRPRRRFARARLHDFTLNASGSTRQMQLLWVLRLMVGARAVDQGAEFAQQLDAEALEGLGIEIDDPGEEFDECELDACLADRLRVLEAMAPMLRGHRLERNVSMIKERLGLSRTECAVLEFLAVETTKQSFSNIVGAVQEAVGLESLATIALCLNLPESGVKEVLSMRSILLRSGLVRIEPRGGLIGNIGYDLLEGLAFALNGNVESVEQIFSNYFRPSPAPELAVDALPHLEQEIRCTSAILAQAASDQMEGVNVLIFGPPGTGKTQLARRIAIEAGLAGHEVSHEDNLGEPLEPRIRQRAYHLSQYLMARNSDALILFDEIEDVFTFNQPGFLLSSRHDRMGGKAWTNQMLEENPVPAIWITNTPRHLDPAYLRRFDYTIEVRHPPRSVRRQLLAESCAELDVSEAWLDRAAEVEGLTPAEIRRTARVARLLRNADPGESIEAFLDEHLARQGELQGRRRPIRRRGADALDYDLTYLNADLDVEPVVRDLVGAKEGSLLVYGPPGTGKTALAHHLAREADRPLIKRAASDLLSPFLGITEQKLAAVFREARDENAVLLLDEADSFLANRANARAQWSVTQTNELLVQIESFDGILVCATNFLEALDPAALRRFDHKLHLQALTQGQRHALFRQLAARLGATDTGDSAAMETALSLLNALDTLTPGDFATVVRRYGQGSARDARLNLSHLAAALESEARIKPGGTARKIGFGSL